jgi:hypothetical protein
MAAAVKGDAASLGCGQCRLACHGWGSGKSNPTANCKSGSQKRRSPQSSEKVRCPCSQRAFGSSVFMSCAWAKWAQSSRLSLLMTQNTRTPHAAGRHLWKEQACFSDPGGVGARTRKTSRSLYKKNPFTRGGERASHSAKCMWKQVRKFRRLWMPGFIPGGSQKKPHALSETPRGYPLLKMGLVGIGGGSQNLF